MKFYSIQAILSKPIPEGWYCLPPDISDWSLSILGFFSEDSSQYPEDSDEYLPIEVRTQGWIVTLDNVSIEDIIINLNEQIENPSIEQLFEAFLFYYENDAFIEI